jgi:hypothetical protein
MDWYDRRSFRLEESVKSRRLVEEEGVKEAIWPVRET